MNEVEAVTVDEDEHEDVIVVEDPAIPVENSVFAHNKKILNLLKNEMEEDWKLLDSRNEKCCPLNLRKRVLENYERAIESIPNKIMSLADLKVGKTSKVRGIGKVGLSKVWSDF
jgi:hypothetical protein